MKQVLLSGQGQVEVLEVPTPAVPSGGALVRNAFSLISSGTEGAAVTRRQGLLGLYEKATNSRDRVNQVVEMAKTQGVARTMELVKQKLEDYTAIGYSCAGLVVEGSHSEGGFRSGERVACMGTGFASHAEFVAVPKNLMARIPSGVGYDEAAFGAVASIALQGIRRLELTPGESIGVIGLGLIGQIAVRLLAAMGYKAYGFDIAQERVKLVADLPGIHAWPSRDVDAVGRIRDVTAARLLDGVLICASTDSDEVVNLAFDLCRQRGRVSVIGDVGLNLQRAKMYAKELELRLSCSYGPGRYDPTYELAGVEYPHGLVRWSEARNLEFFLDLLASRKLDLKNLISSSHPVAEAPRAYAAVKSAGAGTFGVLLDYALPEQPDALDPAPHRVLRHQVPVRQAVAGNRPIRLGLIGVGGYAKAVHIPNLKALSSQFRIDAVASRTGATAAVIARKTGACICSSDYHQILADPNIDAVVISTRHATHGRIVLDALQAGKHVFVEKPMTIDAGEGCLIKTAAAASGLVVRVGFNRRFSPYLGAMKAAVGNSGRRILTCRVNIGALGNDWSSAAEEGGRLMGEGVHFLDLCNWFVGQDPIGLTAATVGAPELSNPDASIVITYPDGSLGVIVYTTLGHKLAGKEFYEAIGGGRLVRMDDFRQLQAFGAGKPRRVRRGDKGQLHQLEEFARAIRGRPAAGDCGADAHAGWLATRMAAAVYESARSGASVKLSQ